MPAPPGPAELALEKLERDLAAGAIDLRRARELAEPATRAFPVEVRSLGEDAAPGSFEAIVSVFGNVDSYGDRMMPGAFKGTLRPPPEGRGLPPVVWSHAWDTPPIGTTLEARETDEGLLIRGRLLVGEDEDHAVARQVWAAMRASSGDGRAPLREWSFGFRTLEARFVTETENPDAWNGEVREVLAVELFEVGPTLVGANPATRSLDVKSRLGGALAARPAQRNAGGLEARSAVTAALLRRRHSPHPVGGPTR